MNSIEVKSEIERYRDRTDIKLEELVQIANHCINFIVPTQPSDRVADTLNERTFRYYISEGLIDRPLGKEGTAALYGYRHLLQALMVKALQGKYLPIKQIKKILEGKNEWNLKEILISLILEDPCKNSGFRELNSALAVLKEIEFDRNKSDFRNNSPSLNSVSWERFILEDGIEVHVRSDRLKGLRGKEIKRILGILINL